MGKLLVMLKVLGCVLCLLCPYLKAHSAVPASQVAVPAYVALKKSVDQLELNPQKELQDQVELSRLYFYLGKFSDLNADRKLALAWFEKGESVALAALEKAEEDAGAVFWWAANVGFIADIRQNLGALKIVKQIETKMLKMREELPEFGYGGPDRVLGKLYHQAPSFVSIGSKKKAEIHLVRAYAEHPEFAGNAVALATFYYEIKKQEKAIPLLAKLKGQKGYLDADYGPFNVEKEWWKQDLEKIEAKAGASIE